MLKSKTVMGRVTRSIVVCAVGCAAFTGAAQAALFEDAEARRAIIELRERVSANQAALQLLTKQSATGAGLLELASQNDALRRELAQLRGQNEELVRSLTAMTERLDKMNGDLSARMSKLEPVTLNVDNVEIIVQPMERAAYDDAISVLRSGDYAAAEAKLDGFLSAYPSTGYRPSALFWLGNAQYASQSFTKALATFKALINEFPQHTRVPESKLALANCQLELKDRAGAQATLSELVNSAPNTEAAQTAQQRLQILR